MKRDLELEKIAGLMRRLDEIQDFLYTNGISVSQRQRVMAYIADRYRWFFEWFARPD